MDYLFQESWDIGDRIGFALMDPVEGAYQAGKGYFFYARYPGDDEYPVASAAEMRELARTILEVVPEDGGDMPKPPPWPPRKEA